MDGSRNLHVLLGAPSRTAQDARRPRRVLLWDHVGVRRAAVGRLDVHRCRTASALAVPLLEGHHLDVAPWRVHRLVHRDQSRWFAPGCSSGQTALHRADRSSADRHHPTNARCGRHQPPIVRCSRPNCASLVGRWPRLRAAGSPAADRCDVRRARFLGHLGHHCDHGRRHRHRHRDHRPGRLDCRVGRGVPACPAGADVLSQMGVGRTA